MARQAKQLRTVITMQIVLSAENAIRFADACDGAAEVLQWMSQQAMQSGDHEVQVGTVRDVYDNNDDAAEIGWIKITEKEV